MSNFWQTLPKPFFALAPMYDVTDFVFREMFARYGKPDLMVTEFVSVDGLCSDKGREHLMGYLRFSNEQRPIIAQIWGTDPPKFKQAAELIKSLGFDGIDINMGCPQSKEIEHGACAALIRNPDLAKSIIAATKQGAGGLPVSVKTRIGYEKVQTEEWARHLLEAKPAAITLHARTKKEISKVPARWDEIAKAVKVRDKLQGTSDKDMTLIIGNGDVQTYQEAVMRTQESGCDGVMIGRGAFGNPWFFANVASFHGRGNLQQSEVLPEVTIEKRLVTMLEHAKLFEKEYQGKKPFVIMRKHFKAYASEFAGAAELRAQLMETTSVDQVETIVSQFLEQKQKAQDVIIHAPVAIQQ